MARKRTSQGKGKRMDRRPRRTVCYFCKEKIEFIDFKDAALLRRYISDRSKIRARRVTGNCQQHQRMVAVAIKNAREMALLPYTPRQGEW
jgi:small subunit ribosomal protein S18